MALTDTRTRVVSGEGPGAVGKTSWQVGYSLMVTPGKALHVKTTTASDSDTEDRESIG